MTVLKDLVAAADRLCKNLDFYVEQEKNAQARMYIALCECRLEAKKILNDLKECKQK